jgi:protein-tyrosine phosphatase
MPPLVIDIRNAEDARDVVHRAVQALAEGQLVALPTETVYGLAASAVLPDAVDRLVRAKGRPTGQPLALAIKSADEAIDFVPDLSPLARRLARRCWPGPVTLVVDNAQRDGLTGQLPKRVRDLVIPNGTIGLRVPANEMSQDVLRMMTGPRVSSARALCAAWPARSSFLFAPAIRAAARWQSCSCGPGLPSLSAAPSTTSKSTASW